MTAYYLCSGQDLGGGTRASSQNDQEGWAAMASHQWPLFPCFRGGSALPPYPGLPLFFSFYWGSGLEFRINDPPRSWPPPLCMLATLSWHMPHRCHLSLSSLVSGDEDTGNLDFFPWLTVHCLVLGSDQQNSAEEKAATFPLDLILGSGLINILWVLGTIWKEWSSPCLQVREQRQMWGTFLSESRQCGDSSLRCGEWCVALNSTT